MLISDTEQNCCFTSENNRFRYRAAAIIIENDCVLVAGNQIDDYYYSVGGAVHLGETANDAVIREVREEAGIECEIERLVFIHENFFNDNDISGLNCHEISFYFLMKPIENQKIHCDSYCTHGKEYMKWIKISDLKNYKVFPEFFADKLLNMPKNIEHILTRDNKTITLNKAIY